MDKSFTQEHLDAAIDSGNLDFPTDFLRFSQLNLERFPIEIFTDLECGRILQDVWPRPSIAVLDKIIMRYPILRQVFESHLMGRHFPAELMRKWGFEYDITNADVSYDDAVTMFPDDIPQRFGYNPRADIETTKAHPEISYFFGQYYSGAVTIEQMLRNNDLYNVLPHELTTKDLKFLLRNTTQPKGLFIRRWHLTPAVRKIAANLNGVSLEIFDPPMDVFKKPIQGIRRTDRWDEIIKTRTENLKHQYSAREAALSMLLPELRVYVFDFLFKHWRDFITIRID